MNKLYLYLPFLVMIFLAGCKKENPAELPIDNTETNNQLKDTIIIGGSFKSADGIQVNNIVLWNGSSFIPLGTGLPGGGVECMAVYKGELYVGGFIDSAGGIPVKNIAKWNGSTWSAVGGGIDGRVTSLAVYNGELYAGGWYSHASGIPAENIAKWNGVSWSLVGNGFNDEVYSLTVYNNSLYAAGWFINDNLKKIARWDGTAWYPVGSNNVFNGNFISDLLVYKDKLYAAGYLNSNGEDHIFGIARLDGSEWETTGTAETSREIFVLGEYQNDLLMGGQFLTINSINTTRLARFNGTTWVSSNIDFNSAPSALYSINNNLYIGGDFDAAGSTEANHIAMWDGTKIYPLAAGINGHVWVIGSYK